MGISPAEANYRDVSLCDAAPKYTGPVHAKGVEDTLRHRYNVLLSLTRSAASGRFGVHSAVFHRENPELECWPLELVATRRRLETW